MGSPITNPPQQPGVSVAAGSIVCLDLRAEGKLLVEGRRRRRLGLRRGPGRRRRQALRHHAPQRHPPAGPRGLLRHDDRPDALAAVRLCGRNAGPRHARGVHAHLADAGRRHDLREHEPRRGGVAGRRGRPDQLVEPLPAGPQRKSAPPGRPLAARFESLPVRSWPALRGPRRQPQGLCLRRRNGADPLAGTTRRPACRDSRSRPAGRRGPLARRRPATA